MPGPIKPAARPGPKGASALIRRVADAAPDGALPDAAPYQSRRQLSVKVHGETLTTDEVYWTRRGLNAWLAACPVATVTVRPDRSYDPEEGAAPRPLPVFIDGYRFDVPVGEPVEIPLPLADIVRWSQRRYRTSQAEGLDLLTISEGTNPNGLYIDFEGAGGGPGPADDEES